MTLMPVLISTAPIFFLIVLGYILRRNGIPNVEFWNMNDKLVYWVLMPALLFHKTSTIELSPGLVGSYSVVIIGGFLVTLVFGLGSAKLVGLPSGSASSMMQGASRHNAFIALSIAGSLFGATGLSLGALAMALLIPATNLAVVPLMVVLNQGDGKGRILPMVLRDLGRNPLIVSVLAGVAFNIFGVGEVPVLHDSAGLLGNAALPIVLMCVGANLRLDVMRASVILLALSIAGKFIVFPLITVVLAMLLGLTELETLVALIFSASPTASSSYTLARQMGGDAPLMAAITTIQTALAFLTLPLSLLVVEQLF
ncbi:AEC family transporter [Candidatus Halocynthiibacter alkanivorans]|uniref:AEC family transporter n=1 Tax=Candidatus Halocynthiibacter alkanivorans TaxID=2267619 RepID=UPI001F429681|nr:AEC family transporter [Candidatus Halocynthiibacter alkanivorans]